MGKKKAKLFLFGSASFVTEPEKFIIEQKSLLKDLSQEKSQSDGETLTSYEQANATTTVCPTPCDLVGSSFATSHSF